MVKLPDDMFKLELLQYMTVVDIIMLDSACMNHKYRSQLLNKLQGVILIKCNDKFTSSQVLKYKWLCLRRIYLARMSIIFDESNLDTAVSTIENNDRYVEQFRYIKHIDMRGSISDYMAIFIISHCLCLLSIYISFQSSDPQVSDHTLKLIAEHCTGL